MGKDSTICLVGDTEPAPLISLGRMACSQPLFLAKFPPFAKLLKPNTIIASGFPSSLDHMSSHASPFARFPSICRPKPFCSNSVFASWLASYAACHLSISSFGLNSGLPLVSNTRPFTAAAAPLVIRPQLAASHLPGRSSIAISRSERIWVIVSTVELRGVEFSSISPTAGLCGSNTNGTPPYSLTNSKYCQARQKYICPFNRFLGSSSIPYLSTSVRNRLICRSLVQVLLLIL